MAKRTSKMSGEIPVTVETIITSKELYDAETGESVLLKHESVKETEYKETISRGWTAMYYKDYDEVMLSTIKSDLDLKIFLTIKNSFTYKKIDVVLNQSKIADEIGCSRRSVSRMFSRLREYEFIAKDSGSYRLNPFIFIPYQSKGVELQQQWSEMHQDQQIQSRKQYGISREEYFDLTEDDLE